VSAARFGSLLILGTLIAVGPALAQGRSDSAPGQTKDKPKESGGSGSGNSGSSGGSSNRGSSDRESSNGGSSSSSSSSASRASQSGISSPITATTSTSAPASSANAIIYYGSWLDDASIVQPGDVWVGLSTGYWTGDGSRQIDAPVASVAVGLTSRFQAGASFSFYHFRDAEGLSESGPGSMSLYGKYVFLDPSASTNSVGVAITPLIEFSPGSTDQMGWALPINVETRRGNARVYGSAGYFSRGSTFATAGVDVPVGSRASLFGSFGQSYARAGTHQTSFGFGGFLTVTPTSGIFVGLGQTLMPSAIGPGGLSLAGGVSFLLPQPASP
jgi:hypothetical protein